MVDSPGPAMARKRLVHSIASSLSRVSISAQPPISSFASENGPSSTVNSPSAYLTFVPSSTGPSPPVATRTPALVASSMNAPISAYISGLGGGIGIDGSARVYPRNRICLAPLVPRAGRLPDPIASSGVLRPPHLFFCPCVERDAARSTRPATIFSRRCGAVLAPAQARLLPQLRLGSCPSSGSALAPARTRGEGGDWLHTSVLGNNVQTESMRPPPGSERV